jgi:hypothetical protein
MSDLMDPNPERDPELVAAQLVTGHLEPGLRKIGLYLDNTEMRRLPDGTVAVAVDTLMGDLAFSDRVQNPERHGIDAEFRQLRREMEKDTFEQRKQQLLEGKGLWEEEL